MRNCRGFTLVELIVYTGLASVLTVAIMSFAIGMMRSQEKAEWQQSVHQNGLFALGRVLEEVRRADDLLVDDSVFGVTEGVLSLEMTAVDENPTVFDVDAGMLRMTQGAGAALDLLEDDLVVEEFLVRNLSVAGRSKVVRVELTVTKANDPLETISLAGAAIIRSQSD